MAELILQPGVNGPVQIQLQVAAGVNTLRGGDEPGEIGGMPVPAVLVRELAHTLGLLPRPEPARPDPADPSQPAEPAQTRPERPAEPPLPESERVGPTETAESVEPAERGDHAGRVDHAERVVPEEAVGHGERVLSGSERAAVDLAALLGIETTAGTALAELPEIAVIEEISGELLALTHAAEIRRIATCHRRACRTGRRPCTHPPTGPGLGPPPPSAGYSPSDRLAGFVRARDRRCRFPGCRARAIRCDLDHNTPWPPAPPAPTTSAACAATTTASATRHPAGRMRRLPDGGLRWTTPGGQHLTTYPPRYGTDDHLPPPAPQPAPPAPPPADPAPNPAGSPPRTLRERVLGRPRQPGEPDDPPPF